MLVLAWLQTTVKEPLQRLLPLVMVYVSGPVCVRKPMRRVSVQL